MTQLSNRRPQPHTPGGRTPVYYGWVMVGLATPVGLLALAAWWVRLPHEEHSERS